MLGEQGNSLANQVTLAFKVAATSSGVALEAPTNGKPDWSLTGVCAPLYSSKDDDLLFIFDVSFQGEVIPELEFAIRVCAVPLEAQRWCLQVMNHVTQEEVAQGNSLLEFDIYLALTDKFGNVLRDELPAAHLPFLQLDAKDGARLAVVKLGEQEWPDKAQLLVNLQQLSANNKTCAVYLVGLVSLHVLYRGANSLLLAVPAICNSHDEWSMRFDHSCQSSMEHQGTRLHQAQSVHAHNMLSCIQVQRRRVHCRPVWASWRIES